jgi:hypothetical protein
LAQPALFQGAGVCSTYRARARTMLTTCSVDYTTKVHQIALAAEAIAYVAPVHSSCRAPANPTLRERDPAFADEFGHRFTRVVSTTRAVHMLIPQIYFAIYCILSYCTPSPLPTPHLLRPPSPLYRHEKRRIPSAHAHHKPRTWTARARHDPATKLKKRPHQTDTHMSSPSPTHNAPQVGQSHPKPQIGIPHAQQMMSTC